MAEEAYQVDPDQVRSHANTLREFRDRADTAVKAGAHVATLDDAYGILCQPFGAMVSEPQNRGVEALTRTREATGRTADDLDAAADSYERFERSVVERLGRIATSVEGTETSGPTWEV